VNVAEEIIVKYTVVLQRENDGGYVVSVPAGEPIPVEDEQLIELL